MARKRKRARGSRDWSEILSKESAYIDQSDTGTGKKREVTGLALSGGGIRSASFALGVIQALEKYNCLESFRYLSSVSGGGYMGVALSWLRKMYPESWKTQLRSKGTRRLREDFFLGSGRSFQQQGNGVWLDFIRQHSNYLQPPHVGVVSLVGVAVRAFLLSVAVYVGLAAVIFVPLQAIEAFPDHTTQAALDWRPTFDFLGIGFAPHIILDIWGLVAILVAWLLLMFTLFSLGTFAISLDSKGELMGLATLALVSLLMIGIGLRPDFMESENASGRITSAVLGAGVACSIGSFTVLIKRIRKDADSKRAGDPLLYDLRLTLQQGSGRLLTAIISLSVLATLPSIAELLRDREPVAIAVLMGAAATAYRLFMIGRKVVPRPILIQAIIVAVFAVTVVSSAVTAYILAERVAGSSSRFIVLSIVVVTIGFFANMNQFGIGRMYRDRLMETFMPDKGSVDRTSWGKAESANKKGGQLRNLWNPKSAKGCLYPLINTNVVLTTSGNDTFRGRGGDSFVLSPKFCGSDATGWIETGKFADRDFKTGTAMAISGAAANPNTAPGGHGFSRNRLVSFLMFFTQIRLGAWAKNPAFDGSTRLASMLDRLIGQRPNFLFPGILSGLLGLKLTESSYFIELTDGGHFDNTGVYELIRRRAKLIVLSQASQDSDFCLSDLANLAEKIRVDFGARLYFGEGVPIQGVLPKRESDHVRVAMAERGHAVARIRYGDKKEEFGWLVYLHATPLDRLAVDVHTYHLQNKTFPNEPTANQFFREAQLEAYRELGYAVTKRFLSAVLDSTKDGAPPTQHSVVLAQLEKFLWPK
jgi:hypothetical protein